MLHLVLDAGGQAVLRQTVQVLQLVPVGDLDPAAPWDQFHRPGQLPALRVLFLDEGQLHVLNVVLFDELDLARVQLGVVRLKVLHRNEKRPRFYGV